MNKKIILGGALLVFLAIVGLTLMLGGETDAKEEGTQVEAQQTKGQDSGNFWTIRCEKDKKHCEVFQRLEVAKTKKRLAEFAVGEPEDGKEPRAAVILPLGLLLPEGLTVQVKDAVSIKVPIRTCGDSGCIAIFNMKSEFMDAMKKGDKLVLKMKDVNGKPVDIVMSLKGFATAMEKI